MFNINASYLFNKYYILLYYSQYHLSRLISSYNDSISLTLFIAFFLLGVSTIFTPCFISILPMSFSYMSSRNNSLLSILVFIFGISTSLLFLLVFANTLGFYVVLSRLPLLFNILLLLISLDLMKIFSFFNFFSFVSSSGTFNMNKSLILQNYVSGLFIGFSSLPCNTSIFFIITFLINNTRSSLYLYVFVYFLGFTVPLLFILSLKLPSISPNYYFISSLSNSTSYISGSFLLILSLFSIMCNVFL